MRTFTTALAISALLTQVSYAQNQMMMSAPPAMTPAERAEIAEKEAAKKATDQRYEESLKHIPESKQKVDPWASVRPAPGK
jgi:hypothetical protein